MTEKTHISKEIAKCVINKSYNPDRVIMKLITKQINCSIPWSNFKLEGMKDCKSENDFELYLDTIVKLQSKIKKVPKKCMFKTWTPLPYSEGSTDGNKETKTVIELLIVDSKVWSMAPKIIKVTLSIDTDSIVSGNYQGGGRIYVLDWLLSWYLWRVFGIIPRRKHSWHFRIL